MGTATAIVYVDASNAYHGGAIAPGMGISLDALTNHGALLSSVDMKAPKKVISSNTSDCIRSGIMFGTACMLDGMVDMFTEECKTECKVIATGGLAPLAIKTAVTILSLMRILFLTDSKLFTREIKNKDNLIYNLF